MSPRGDFWLTLEERLLAKLAWDEDCLVSSHGCDGAGYPLIYGEGRQRRVHQVWWEREHGEKPAGMDIDHTCTRFGKRCVAHLELVTHAENVRRGLAAKRLLQEV